MNRYAMLYQWSINQADRTAVLRYLACCCWNEAAYYGLLREIAVPAELWPGDAYERITELHTLANQLKGATYAQTTTTA